MATPPDSPGSRSTPAELTTGDAVANAIRLLAHAEDETNLARLDSLVAMAAVWVSVAGLIHDTT